MVKRLAVLALLAGLCRCEAQFDPGVDPAYLSHFLATAPTGPTNLSGNLFVWWKFDEGSGTSVADSSDGKTGTLNGGATWVTGKIGPYAMSLTGTSGDDQYAYNNTLTTQSAQGAMTWWAFPTNVYERTTSEGFWGWFASPDDWNAQIFAASPQSRSNRWYIGSNANSHECRLIFDADWVNYPQTNWIHYAFVWGPGGQFFYTNGVLCISNSFDSGTNLVATDYLHVGKLGQNPVWFSGSIDDFRYYTNSLTSNDVNYLYFTVYGQSNQNYQPNLTHLYTFDEGSGVAHDTGCEQRYDATLSGGGGYTASAKVGANAFDDSTGSGYATTSGFGNSVLSRQGTIAWWQYAYTAYNAGTIQGMWGWGSGDWDAQRFSNGNFYIGASADPDWRIVVAANAANWPQNAWIHYIFTWADSGQCFYTNGVLCASNVRNSGQLIQGGTSFRIGSLGNGGNPLSGRIDDLRIYNGPLNTLQVSNLYHYIYGQ